MNNASIADKIVNFGKTHQKTIFLNISKQTVHCFKGKKQNLHDGKN